MSEQNNLVEQWAVKNAQRVYVITGFALVALTITTLMTGLYFQSVLMGVFGVWLLGGWPALRRLSRNPNMQLQHWYDILRDERQLHICESSDGATKVVVMRPIRRDGWQWIEA